MDSNPYRNMSTVWMLVLFLSVASVPVVLAETIAALCDYDRPNTCYRVYGEYNDSLTWDKAYEACKHLNQTLAVIPDDTTQQLITRIGRLTKGEAWISGQGQFDTWMSINSSLIPAEYSISGSDNSSASCVVLKINPESPLLTTLSAAGCNSSVGRRALCQYPQTGRCDKVFNQFTTCYKVPSETVTTFAEAETLCRGIDAPDSNTQPSLAYTRVNEQNLQYTIYYNYKSTGSSIPEDNEFWLGIHRDYEWTWTNDSAKIPLTYTNWAINQPQIAGLRSCIAVSLASGSTWVSSACNSNKSHYICTADPDDIPTIPQTTMEAVTSAPTTPTTTTTPTPTTVQPGNSSLAGSLQKSKTNDFVIVLIIVFAVGGFLFIVGLIVVVCFARAEEKEEASDFDADADATVSGFDVYSQPQGVRSSISQFFRGRSPSDGRAVLKKSKSGADRDQSLEDIFITPTVPRENRPDGSETSNSATREFAVDQVVEKSAGRFTVISDDFVTGNPVYSVNRSQFTTSKPPTSVPSMTSAAASNYVNVQTGTWQTSTTAPPIPPKGSTLQRRLTDNADTLLKPPIPSDSDIESQDNPTSIQTGRSGGIDLNRDNMMF